MKLSGFEYRSGKPGRRLCLVCNRHFTRGWGKAELAGLHWNDVDFDKRLITVQRSFDGPTKAGDVRYVPILAPLLPILRQWRLQCRTPLVFPNNVGTMHQPSARIFQKRSFSQNAEACWFWRCYKGQKKRPYLRFHDLRHTFASLWVKNGGEMYRLQKFLAISQCRWPIATHIWHLTYIRKILID